jgi:hypothetical protein
MIFLSPAELKRLTGKVRYSAQRRALARLKIPYTQAATGEPLVRTDALDAAGKPAQRRGHRWDQIGSVRNLRP